MSGDKGIIDIGEGSGWGRWCSAKQREKVFFLGRMTGIERFSLESPSGNDQREYDTEQ